MSRHTAHIRIDGEPFLSRAKAYREQRHAALVAWSDFCKKMGGTSIPGGLHGLNFEGRRTGPDGWTKPKGRNGYSSPKKGHPDVAVIETIRAKFPMPNPRDVFGDAIVESLSYEGPDGKWRGGGVIGGIWSAHIGWAGDTFYAIVPDAEAAVRDHLAERPSDVILHGAADWRMPEGLTRLTKAEYDLAFAQYAVEEERAAHAASNAA